MFPVCNDERLVRMEGVILHPKIAKCPYCNREVILQFRPAKWQGEEDRVIITHVKWQMNWR